MKLQNRGNYKILFIETIEIRLWDIPRALDELGFDVYKANLEILAQGFKKKDCEKIVAAIDEFEIQCAISYDFAESIAQACFETGIPYISWVYDAPQKELYTHFAFYPCNYIFVFDKMQKKRLDEIGLKNVYHMPLAIHANKVKGALKEETSPQYDNEITFVGQLYKIGNLDIVFEDAHEDIKKHMINIFKSCFLKWNENVHMHEIMNKSCVQYLSKIEKGEVKKRYPYMTEAFYYETAILSRLLANQERVHILNRLAEKYDVKFYTNDEDTTQLSPKVKVMPGVQYDSEISRLYRDSKINLNITLHCIETGVSQRVFDVMAAGGFLISNYQKELEELFIPGEEIILYHDEEELMQLVAYYLEHEEERFAIATRGQKKVLACHDFHSKLLKVMELVAQKETLRQDTYIVLQRNWLRQKADKLLPKKTYDAYKELYQIFTDERYDTTIKKTTDLGILREMLACWHMGLQTAGESVFADVETVKQAEQKYIRIKHGLWRIEMNLSAERCMEAVEWMYRNKTSKLFIAWLIYANLRDREQTFVRLAEYWKKYSIAEALELLSYGLIFYPKHSSILLQKANCLMEVGAWTEVLKTLYLIENPTKDVCEMILELERVLKEKGHE